MIPRQKKIKMTHSELAESIFTKLSHDDDFITESGENSELGNRLRLF